MAGNDMEVVFRIRGDASSGVAAFSELKKGVSSAEGEFKKASSSMASQAGATQQALQRLAVQARATGAELDRGLSGRALLDPLTASVARATEGFGALATRLRGIPAALSRFSGAIGIGGGGLAASVLAIAKASANASSEIGAMSQRTGVGTEALSRLAYAARAAGGSTSALEGGLQSLAVNMALAAKGGGASAAMFDRLGIAVTRSDGSLRSTDEVFVDLAQRLSELPDGIVKTTAAVGLLGKGADELVPVLNLGREGLAALANESDRFGQTISESAAAAALEFNRNLERLQGLTQGVVVQIGNALIPGLSRLAADFLRAKEVGLGFGQALLTIGLSNPFKSAEEQVGSLTSKLAELKKRREDALGFVGGRAEASAVLPLIDAEIALRQRELAYWESKVSEAQSGPDLTEQKKLAQARLKIEAQLSAEISNLDKLRATAALNATKEEIKGAERLRDALRNAWEESTTAASEARREAAAFFRQADEATSRRNADANRLDASSEEQAGGLSGFSSANSPGTLIAEAERAALFAQNAAIDGRGEAVRKNAEEALRLAEEAAGYVQGMGDDPSAVRLLRQIGEAESQALRAQGKQREQEANAQEAAATAIDAQIQAAEQRLTGLRDQLGQPVSIQVDVTAAEQRIKALQAQLAKLGEAPGGGADGAANGAASGIDKTATIRADTTQAEQALGEVKGAVDAVPAEKATLVEADAAAAQQTLAEVQRAVDAIPAEKTIIVRTVSEGGTPTFSDPVSDWNSKQNGFAAGGLIRGPGTGTSDSILARLSDGEFVVRAAAVRHYGTDLLARLNGLRLPRFAEGGLVSSGVMPVGSDGGGGGNTPVVLDFGDLGRYQTTAKQDIADEIVKTFRRAALQRGRRG
ncbi:hypothetical protein [Thauera aminoaromatica]|uniref:Phage tail tape measure protein n=1 Tax=Thauera aminoaromatica S2 TaxID=1234381 RepID=N6Z041_THASP|nr:hypothetical protein [Thauera aminoaromatica]ENO85539.1 phage tail tape measure protein [Thauera aminoaromatica S2]